MSMTLPREKLATLRMTGEMVRKRRREHQERPEAINQFGQCMQLAQKAVDSFKVTLLLPIVSSRSMTTMVLQAGDDKFNHLDTAEVEKVQKAIQEKQDWFNRMCADVAQMVGQSFILVVFVCNALPQDKTTDPPVLASQFYQEKESFWHMASNILNKPKPKVEPPPPMPADAAKGDGMDDGMPAGPPAPAGLYDDRAPPTEEELAAAEAGDLEAASEPPPAEAKPPPPEMDVD
jgi:heat shock protein